MEAARLNKLKEIIGLPDMRKRIIPTVLFRGGVHPRKMHAMFNFACAMMMSECQSFADGKKLYDGGEIAHLCGFHAKTVNSCSLRGGFNRLKLCPEVTAIVPTLTEYVEWVWPRTFHLEPVSLVSTYETKRENVAAWRQARPYKIRVVGARVVLDYPYINPKQDSCSHNHAEHGNALVMAVHSLVPKGIPHEIRSDLCQDLIVAVLSGDSSLENLPNLLEKYLRNAKKFMADRHGMKSLDAPLGFDEDTTLGEVLYA